MFPFISTKLESYLHPSSVDGPVVLERKNGKCQKFIEGWTETDKCTDDRLLKKALTYESSGEQNI